MTGSGSPRSSAPAGGAGSSQARPRMRVLIVDDNPAIHEDFRKILLGRPKDQHDFLRLERELFGNASAPEADSNDKTEFELEMAHQGEEAVELARAALDAGRPFQLAFVDGRMPPGMSGIDTIAGLWDVDPRLQVVVCTAFSDHSWSDIVRKLGHSDGLLVLRKPFDGIEVLQLAH